MKQIVATLNRVLRGWGNYFRTGNSDRQFTSIDAYVHECLNRWHYRRGGQRAQFRYAQWPHARYYGLGLHQLRTTVAYPAQATPVRPSVSRVREIGMHGLTMLAQASSSTAGRATPRITPPADAATSSGDSSTR